MEYDDFDYDNDDNDDIRMYRTEYEAAKRNSEMEPPCDHCGHGLEHHKHAAECRFENCWCREYR